MNRSLEKLIKNYEEHCKRIQQATTIDINENSGEKRKRVKRLEQEYTDWFEYYFPHYAKSKSAKFHKKMARIIIDNDVVSLLAEIYRSGAKSVHLDMGIPLYLYVTGELRFMLLIGETEKKAKKLIGDIQAQLQYNQRFINDYGRRFKFGDWSDGDFTTTDGAKFMAFGIGQSVRGVREGENRPDYIVVDDVDAKKRCNNDMLSRKAYEYVWEDVQGTFERGGKKRRFIVANNNFHPNTIINQMKITFKGLIKKAKEKGRKVKHFILTVKAVKDLIDFEPAWPENTSSDYWKDEFDDWPYRSFMREFMHEHIQDGTIFKNENIVYGKRLQLRQYDSLVFYGDLSYKDKGDYKAMIFLGKKGKEYHILGVYLRKSSRAMVAKWLYDIYEKRNLSKYNIRYYIEGLFAQDEFVNDFDLEGEERGYYIPVVADRDTKGNKFDRVESIAGYFERHNIIIDSDLKEDADTLVLIDQLLAFEKGSGANDDGPDALQGAISKTNKITRTESFEARMTSREDIKRKSKHRY